MPATPSLSQQWPSNANPRLSASKNPRPGSVRYSSPNQPLPNTLRPGSAPPEASSNPPHQMPHQIPDSVLQIISQSLPPAFRRICPFSLCGMQDCPLPNCGMKKLCREFNDDRNGLYFGQPEHTHFSASTPSKSEQLKPLISAQPSKTIPNTQNCQSGQSSPKKQNFDSDKGLFCSKKKCNNVHEFATCIDDLWYLFTTEERASKWPRGCQRKGKNWKWHAKKRLHMEKSGQEEWRLREAIAGLRDAHRMGRYL